MCAHSRCIPLLFATLVSAISCRRIRVDLSQNEGGHRTATDGLETSKEQWRSHDGNSRFFTDFLLSSKSSDTTAFRMALGGSRQSFSSPRYRHGRVAMEPADEQDENSKDKKKVNPFLDFGGALFGAASAAAGASINSPAADEVEVIPADEEDLVQELLKLPRLDHRSPISKELALPQLAMYEDCRRRGVSVEVKDSLVDGKSHKWVWSEKHDDWLPIVPKSHWYFSKDWRSKGNVIPLEARLEQEGLLDFGQRTLERKSAFDARSTKRRLLQMVVEGGEEVMLKYLDSLVLEGKVRKVVVPAKKRKGAAGLASFAAPSSGQAKFDNRMKQMFGKMQQQKEKAGMETDSYLTPSEKDEEETEKFPWETGLF